MYFLFPPEEFTRAVYVATGIKLTQHLVNTVFKIFDEDHDDKLSYKEFIGIMKDRLHRGDRVRTFSVVLCDTEGVTDSSSLVGLRELRELFWGLMRRRGVQR